MTESSRALLAVPPSRTLSRLRTTPYFPLFSSPSRVTSLVVRMGLLPAGGPVDTNHEGRPSVHT